MNESTNGKSMDDVLASIRRIVRTERQPAEAAPETPAEAPLAETPLELTPDMRSDGDTPEVDQPEAEAMETVTVHEEPTAPAIAPDDDAIRALVRETVMELLQGPDGDALIRSVIRDELVNGEIGGNISENVLRLIQSEVAGALQS